LLEEDWGLSTLEIPQSVVCSLPAFQMFAAQLLFELPRFREVYNTAIDEFRRVNRIRSVKHPAPHLAADADWLEAPFWLWSRGDPRRRRAMVRRAGDELVISDGGQVEFRLPRHDSAEAVARLAGLAERSIKLRTRALITTMWARLFLSDLFLHGIGGSKYDQLTDEIVRRFFGGQPPRYATASATLLLPISPWSGKPGASRDELTRNKQRLRELEFHPERFADSLELTSEARETVQQVAAEKKAWVATPPDRENAKKRCHGIRQANQSLQPFVQPLRELCLRESADLSRRAAAEVVLASREYSFALHGEQRLQGFMLEIRRRKP
jgi:hypothetical protein